MGWFSLVLDLLHEPLDGADHHKDEQYPGEVNFSRGHCESGEEVQEQEELGADMG